MRAFVKTLTHEMITSKTEQQVRMFVCRAVKDTMKHGRIDETRKHQKDTSKKRYVRFRERRRRPGNQGRPFKASLLRETLFNWFQNIKRSIAGRLLPSVVRNKAQALLSDYIEEHAKLGLQCDAPKIDADWVTRWRHEYNICFRIPNRKWKVPRAVLLERLGITWENTYRVRQLALRVLGYDLPADNMDQSLSHANEAGSSQMNTLSIRGSGVVALKGKPLGHTRAHHKCYMVHL